MPSKDIRALVRRLRQQGFTVHFGGSGHLRVTSPTGGAITMSGSPRRPALDRVRADLRRIGADL